ncbi:MAG: hypothetical protein AAGA03_09590, partial [Planctomycetota bacterium]
MHDDLLGYLLGALEPHEMRRVDKLLADSEEARQELARLKSSLGPLEQARDADPLPPVDLVSRTLDALPPLPPPGVEGSAAADLANDPWESAARESSLHLTPLSQVNEVRGRRSWSWLDLMAGMAASIALLGVLLPSVMEGRFSARRLACQDNLKQVGEAIASFVMRNSDGRLPAVAASGPEAFAGVYAVRLNEAGLLSDGRVLQCPSVDRRSVDAADGTPVALSTRPRLVSMSQLHDSSVDELRSLQYSAGGSYAYTLGVVDQQGYASPRYQSRSMFAVMSDAPQVRIDDAASLNQALDRSSLGGTQLGHSGRGMNMLYEDGSVRFVSLKALAAMPDHPLLNHRGRPEAGIDGDDASLAPSWHPPFLGAKQQ